MDNQQPGNKPNEPTTSAGDPAAIHPLSQNGSGLSSHDEEKMQAVELGKSMVEHGWYVVTGAATGIMEAGHVGAGREHSMGLNIMLPFEQESNEIIVAMPSWSP